MKRFLAASLCACLLLLCGCEMASPNAEEESRAHSFLEAESRTPEELAILAGKTVILDPGHGFDDPGCEYPENGVIERELTLLLAEKIADLLEQHGVTVIFTHLGEGFPGREALAALAAQKGYDIEAYLNDLIASYSGREGDSVGETVAAFGAGVNDDTVFDTFERAYYANLQGGDLFLSVHINASGTNSHAMGSDLFVCSDTPHKEASRQLMTNMKLAIEHTFPARRVGDRSDSWGNAFVVTKYPDMPSLLLEVGFASNGEDAKNLTDPAWQDEFARAAAKGVEMYLLEF